MSIDYYMKMGAAQGWQCPICGRILSPWTQECPCKGQPQTTITSTTVQIKGDENLEPRINVDGDKVETLTPTLTIDWTKTESNSLNKHIPTIF